MEDLIQGFKEMSKLEKVLVGVTFGGIILHHIIPSEYTRLELIPLAVSGTACMGLGVKAMYKLFMGDYHSEKPYSSNNLPTE